jgi:hypothetical protein
MPKTSLDKMIGRQQGNLDIIGFNPRYLFYSSRGTDIDDRDPNTPHNTRYFVGLDSRNDPITLPTLNPLGR